jgi:hypothetical protein
LTNATLRDSHEEIGGSMEEVSVKDQIKALEEQLEAFGRYL